ASASTGPGARGARRPLPAGGLWRAAPPHRHRGRRRGPARQRRARSSRRRGHARAGDVRAGAGDQPRLRRLPRGTDEPGVGKVAGGRLGRGGFRQHRPVSLLAREHHARPGDGNVALHRPADLQRAALWPAAKRHAGRGDHLDGARPGESPRRAQLPVARDAVDGLALHVGPGALGDRGVPEARRAPGAQPGAAERVAAGLLGQRGDAGEDRHARDAAVPHRGRRDARAGAGAAADARPRARRVGGLQRLPRGRAEPVAAGVAGGNARHDDGLSDRAVRHPPAQPDARQRHGPRPLQRAADLQRAAVRPAARGNAGRRHHLVRSGGGKPSRQSQVPGAAHAVARMAPHARRRPVGDRRVPQARREAGAQPGAGQRRPAGLLAQRVHRREVWPRARAGVPHGTGKVHAV
ncbi:MAG: Putative diheme cytochrome c-553, partial [uncultured Gemmatimonadetes bacterium]